MTVPFQYDDATKIDGCGCLSTYWKILLPQIKPALMVVAVSSFMIHWNDFMGPLIYINSQEKYTLALGLRLFQGLYVTQVGASYGCFYCCIYSFCGHLFLSSEILNSGCSNYRIKGVIM